MANYEITEGHSILIMGSTPTNKAIVLLLSYIYHDPQCPISKYDHLGPFMANYGQLLENRRSDHLDFRLYPHLLNYCGSFGTNLNSLVKKTSEIGKTPISAQLAPISGSCPILTQHQEVASCSVDNFGPESIIKQTGSITSRCQASSQGLLK